MTNPGAIAWEAAKRRRQELDTERDDLRGELAALDIEAERLDYWLDYCADLADGDLPSADDVRGILNETEIAERGPDRVPQGRARASAVAGVEPEETPLVAVSSGEAAPTSERAGDDAGLASTPARPDYDPMPDPWPEMPDHLRRTAASPDRTVGEP